MRNFDERSEIVVGIERIPGLYRKRFFDDLLYELIVYGLMYDKS